MTTFTDYLEEIHGKEYENMPDFRLYAFKNWLRKLSVNNIIEYAEQYAVLTQREVIKRIYIPIKELREQKANVGEFWLPLYKGDIQKLDDIIALLKKLEGKV